MRNPPSVSPFASPFLPVERWLFRQPWLVVIGSASIAALAARYVGLGLLPVAATLALGQLLFQRWCAGLPGFFNWLQQHRVVPEQRDAWVATVAQYDPREAIGWRLGLTAPSLVYATMFAFQWYGNNRRGLCFSLCFGLWIWMAATVGVVTLRFAQCLRALANQDLLHVAPEHPDRCGGWARVGGCLAFMVSPLVIGSLVFALFAFNPQLPPPAWAWASGVLCFQTEDCDVLYDAARTGHERAIRAELLDRRLEALQKHCADPRIEETAFEECVAEALSLDHEREVFRRGRKLLSEAIVPYARVGLLCVVIVLLVLLSPAWSLHQSMLRQRDKRLLYETELIANIEAQLQAEIRDGAVRPEERLLAFHNIRGALLGRRFPLWPFNVPTLIRTAAPPLIAVATTLLRDLGLW